jgi:hypothetical protein
MSFDYMGILKVVDTLRSVSPTALREDDMEVRFCVGDLNQVVIDLVKWNDAGTSFDQRRITLDHNQAMQAFAKVIAAIHP